MQFCPQRPPVLQLMYTLIHFAFIMDGNFKTLPELKGLRLPFYVFDDENK